jgi:hypothetical protein
MSLFNNKKRRLSLVGLVLVSFSIMAAFSIFLHDHEFDLHSTDEDCAPCHWTQVSVNADSDIPSVDFIPVISSNAVETGALHHKSFKYSYFGLSPPIFS